MLNIIHNVLKFYGADKNFSIDQDLNSNVTRAEMTQIIFKAFERKNNPGQKIYSDLNDKHWAYNFLMDASEWYDGNKIFVDKKTLGLKIKIRPRVFLCA